MLTVYKMTITSVNLLAAADEMSDSVEFCEHHSNLAAGTARLYEAARAIAPEPAWEDLNLRSGMAVAVMAEAWRQQGYLGAGMSVTVGDTEYHAGVLKISVI